MAGREQALIKQLRALRANAPIDASRLQQHAPMVVDLFGGDPSRAFDQMRYVDDAKTGDEDHIWAAIVGFGLGPGSGGSKQRLTDWGKTLQPPRSYRQVLRWSDDGIVAIARHLLTRDWEADLFVRVEAEPCEVDGTVQISVLLTNNNLPTDIRIIFHLWTAEGESSWTVINLNPEVWTEFSIRVDSDEMDLRIAWPDGIQAHVEATSDLRNLGLVSLVQVYPFELDMTIDSAY